MKFIMAISVYVWVVLIGMWQEHVWNKYTALWMLTNKMVFVCVMWGSLKGLQAGVRDVHKGSTTMKAIVYTYANSMKNGKMDDVFV